MRAPRRESTATAHSGGPSDMPHAGPRAPGVGELVDTSSLLGLSSPAARAVMWLFVFSNFVYAFATLDDVKNRFPVLLAVLLVNGAAILLVQVHPDPFPLLWTIAILAVVTASTLLVAFQLPDVGPPGRAGWHLGSNTWLLFFLALRRRPVTAWLGYVLMAACTIAWTETTGRGIVEGVMLLDTHAAILLAATLFDVNMRRTAKRINDFDGHSVDSAIEAAEGATSAQIRKRRVVELRESAEPLLTKIVSYGAATDPTERRRYAAAEAFLRDGVRGRSLMTPVIAEAATSARERGVEVTLLDDRGQGLPTGEAMMRMSSAVVAALDDADAGSVTVRLVPQGRAVAVSIVTSSGRARVDLDAFGEPVGRR